MLQKAAMFGPGLKKEQPCKLSRSSVCGKGNDKCPSCGKSFDQILQFALEHKSVGDGPSLGSVLVGRCFQARASRCENKEYFVWQMSAGLVGPHASLGWCGGTKTCLGSRL